MTVDSEARDGARPRLVPDRLGGRRLVVGARDVVLTTGEIAYLDVRDAKYFSWITFTTAEHHSPHEAIQREIELIATAVTTPGSEGSSFLNAASEFSDPSHPVRLRVAKHKSDVVQHFRSLAQQAGIVDARRFAEHLALLTDGAYEAARVSGPTGPAAQSERLASGMLA